MKFFKKPVIAVILSVILICTVTSAAVRMKINNLGKEVIYGFYDGVYYNGELQESIESRLRTIIEYANEIEEIAERNHLDAEPLADAVYTLELNFAYSEDEIYYIYGSYEDLMEAIKDTEILLESVTLTEAELERLSEIDAAIDEQVVGIKNSGYNETVKEWERENDSELFQWFVWNTNVTVPEPFSR